MDARRVCVPLLLAALAVLALAAPSEAQTERIVRYDVDIGIQRDGSLLVVERIDYDFGSTQRHGIFREIPATFTYDDDDRYDRVYPIDVQAVQGSAGTPDAYEEEKSGGLFVIKIGDPEKTITGRHTYTITYRVRGALNGFADHDELYWNAVGPGWSVPIGPVAVRVTAPGRIGDRVACFAGPVGSSLGCSSVKAGGMTATFQQPGLGTGEALTVVVGFPTGIVPSPQPLLEERFSLDRAFARTPLSIGLTSLVVLVVFGGLGWLLWTRGRDARALGSPVDIAYASSTNGMQRVPLFEQGTYPVEYVPPEDIRPGQVGTLVDEQANPLDVTATIVDLAVRGYVLIEEIPKRGWFGKPDWRLIRLKDPDGLLPYERVLLDGVFEDTEIDQNGRVTVLLSDMRKKFAARFKRVQEALYDDAQRRKWFAGRPDKVRDTWHTRGWALAIVGGGLLWLAVSNTHLALVTLPIIVGGLAMAAASRWMPRRTPKGTGMVRRVLGFRTYIETAEEQEARFQERENIFSRYLPYAIVFGCTEKWARAFAHLGDEPPATSWYVGPHPFTFSSFTSSIDHFSVNTAGTISSTPSGSGASGLGGGGSSGGGGGGGGGGSW